MATKKTDRHDFSTVAGISDYFVAQGWTLPVERLDDPSYIEGWRAAWREKEKMPYGFSKAAIDPPATQDLFSLAVDASYGPYVHARGLRFKVARLMATQDLEEKGNFVKQPNGKPYATSACNQTITNMESAGIEKRPATMNLVQSVAQGLAPLYHVNPQWLVGESLPYDAMLQAMVSQTISGDDQGEVRKGHGTHALTLFPEWLVPWMRAVDVAVSTYAVLDNDHFLTDARFAAEHVERFIQHQRTTIEKDPARWSLLIYMPLAHAALVHAREHVLESIPAWMIPDGDGDALRLSVWQRSRRQAFQSEVKRRKARTK